MNWEALTQDVNEHPDSYQYERAARFGVSQQGIAYALKKLALSRLRSRTVSRKKTTFQHPKADPTAQPVFQTQIADVKKANQPIVYLDESGFAHDMPRR